MIWRFNKRTDSDLISNNIKPWVDIFWVSWSYWGLVSNWFPLWIIYCQNNDDIRTWAYWNNAIRFYDDWTKIIVMWCVTANVQWGWIWRCFYYNEINKTTLAITRYPQLYVSNYSLTYNPTVWTYMFSYSGWYAFICSDWYTWYTNYPDVALFNWTSLVTISATWTSIWSSTLSLAWKTLSWWVENNIIQWWTIDYMSAYWYLNFS